jgi:hypothetical protein
MAKISLFSLNLIKFLIYSTFYIFAISTDGIVGPDSRVADTDPAFHIEADTDSAFHIDADPDPAFQFDADPDSDSVSPLLCGSGSSFPK